MAWSKLSTLGTVAAVLVTGTIVLLLATLPVRSPGHLLNGTRVVLQSAAYGTAYSPPRPLLDRLLARLPAAWLSRLHYTLCSGPSGAVPTTAGGFYCFWLDFSSPNAESQKIGYAIADEKGFESSMVFGGFYGPYTPGGFARNHSGLSRGAGLFPRQGSRFSLRLYQQDASGRRVLVAQFPVKNLVPQRAPAWEAQPLPSSLETNGLGLTFASAQVGIPCPGPLVAPFDLQAGEWSEFRFRVTERGQPDVGWTINEIWISDATGQSIRLSGQDTGSFNGQFSRTEGDQIVCVHRWDYWSDEPAWTFRVHFEHPTRPGCWAEYVARPHFQHRP